MFGFQTPDRRERDAPLPPTNAFPRLKDLVFRRNRDPGADRGVLKRDDPQGVKSIIGPLSHGPLPRVVGMREDAAERIDVFRQQEDIGIVVTLVKRQRFAHEHATATT